MPQRICQINLFTLALVPLLDLEVRHVLTHRTRQHYTCHHIGHLTYYIHLDWPIFCQALEIPDLLLDLFF